jgi:hypothetical protein
VNAARPTPQFYAPGPIIEAEIVNTSHPIFYGYVEEDQRAVWQRPAAPGAGGQQQPGADAVSGRRRPVLSGLMKGAARSATVPPSSTSRRARAAS